MQIHYNCMRNPNSAMFARLGPDSGFDCMNNVNCAGSLYALLDALYAQDALPRTILYSLNPGENELLDTMIGAFQGPGVPGKLQHGSAWWFNDNRFGMEAQLNALSMQSLFSRFVGMLTDSRSFVSYPRHDYFRRIVCTLIGRDIEEGKIPVSELTRIGKMVEDISYYNAKSYFKF
ncbi:glucuronate isomerase [uncultured Muribaculum sp.]|uniref:glucuronate isomerase n=1 Tax=uncultured Muribaculum sp. TaxID=1918613 RepID=UPI00272AF4A1|nr:glucuronate isomerase [uncultured Muribaculum sp.]